MPEPFPIVAVPADAHRQDETLGTKFKFWYFEGDHKILFKRGRANEDWSEKIAAELAHAIGIPAALVDLADLEGRAGIVSPSFLAPGEQLFHGNELLMVRAEDYPVYDRYHVGQHTLDLVFEALASPRTEATPSSLATPEDWDAQDQLVGYLLLDALIGNTDRHHENWAIYTKENRRYLAPTYDHASSLGRNESDRKIDLYLSGRDPRVSVGTYAARARSALYADPEATKPLSTLDAFRSGAARRPRAARFWFSQLAAIPEEEIRILFERLPSSRINPPNREFAARIVSTNTSRLRAVVTELR